MKRIFPLLLLLVLPSWPAFSQSAARSEGVVGYSIGGVLTIKSADGKTLHVFKTNPPVGTFALSPNGQSVVFAPLGPKPNHNGGPLYLLSIPSGKTRRLTHGRIYSKWEAYSDPDFSPDGKEVVFAIHSQLGPVPTDGDDAVMDAGPFAVLDLRTGVVKKLPSTLHIGGEGPAYGGSPHWSPNGKKILLNLGFFFALTGPSGDHLQDTSDWASANEVTYAVNWLGNACIVYIGGKDWKTAEEQPAKVLNLLTHKTEPLDKLFDVNPDQVTNLVAFSPSISVRELADYLIVQTGNGSWSLPNAGKYSDVRVLPASADPQIPSACR